MISYASPHLATKLNVSQFLVYIYWEQLLDAFLIMDQIL